MALKTVDLTQQPERAVFTGCSQEEVNYAKTFWQSIQLLPPMESRLVSSDIKQRLRRAPPSRSMSNYTGVRTGSEASNLRDFFVRAKTMENIEEFKRLRRFASAREEDRELLHRHRAQRIKKEEISRRSNSSRNLTALTSGLSAFSRDEDELLTDDTSATDVMGEISKFEKLKGVQDDRDSDDEK